MNHLLYTGIKPLSYNNLWELISTQSNLNTPAFCSDWQPRTMRVSVACSTALLLGLLLAKVKADVCADFANGCSVPFKLQYFNKDLFTPSCNRHDVCYRCVRISHTTPLMYSQFRQCFNCLRVDCNTSQFGLCLVQGY